MMLSHYSKAHQILRKWLIKQRAKNPSNTNRKVGERLDIHHSTVSKIESGRRQLNVIEYIEYCDAIDCDPVEGIKEVKKVSDIGNNPS